MHAKDIAIQYLKDFTMTIYAFLCNMITQSSSLAQYIVHYVCCTDRNLHYIKHCIVIHRLSENVRYLYCSQPNHYSSFSQ